MRLLIIATIIATSAIADTQKATISKTILAAYVKAGNAAQAELRELKKATPSLKSRIKAERTRGKISTAEANKKLADADSQLKIKENVVAQMLAKYKAAKAGDLIKLYECGEAVMSTNPEVKAIIPFGSYSKFQTINASTILVNATTVTWNKTRIGAELGRNGREWSEPIRHKTLICMTGAGLGEIPDEQAFAFVFLQKDGSHTYTTALGGSKTVPKYKVILDARPPR